MWGKPRVIDPAETSTSLTGGFRHLADAQRLSVPTIRVLVRLTSCLLPQRRSVTIHNTQTFQDFEDACPCLASSDVTFEKVLCLTIMAYCNLVSSPNGRGFDLTLMFGARRNLLTEAVTTWPEPHPAEKASFIWIIATAALSWCGKLKKVPDKIAGLFNRLLSMFENLHWADIITILRDFIWDERFTSQLFELWLVYGNTPIRSDGQTANVG